MDCRRILRYTTHGMHDLRDVGGTRGGLIYFIVGLGLAVVGLYLLMERVSVYGGYWNLWGSPSASFGITLIPVMLGIGLLFYSSKSVLGWVLFAGGLIAILAGLIASLQIHFQSSTLFETLVMVGLIAAGVGLVIRSLAPAGGDARERFQHRR